jgi:hypothetical protein
LPDPRRRWRTSRQRRARADATRRGVADRRASAGLIAAQRGRTIERKIRSPPDASVHASGGRGECASSCLSSWRPSACVP